MSIPNLKSAALNVLDFVRVQPLAHGHSKIIISASVHSNDLADVIIKQLSNST